MTPMVYRQFSNDSSLELVKGMSDWEAFLEKEKPRAAYFTASWCGPCQQIKPIYEAMAAHEDNQGISFAKIDVDEAREVAGAVGIKSVPTFIFMGSDGQVASHFAGADTKQLEASIAKLK